MPRRAFGPSRYFSVGESGSPLRGPAHQVVEALGGGTPIGDRAVDRPPPPALLPALMRRCRVVDRERMSE